MRPEAAEQRSVWSRGSTKYNLLAVPVLERDGSVVGLVTVDDVVDVLIEEQTEDMYHMAGVGVQERATSPMLESPRRRVPGSGSTWRGRGIRWRELRPPTLESIAELVVFSR